MNLPYPGNRMSWAVAAQEADAIAWPDLPRVGVISNFRSHRNRKEQRHPLDLPEALVIRQAPDSPEALDRAMRRFVREHVDLVVIDGGDGTVREVIGAARRAYAGRMPRFAILRAGKTNALAMDLGVPKDWSLEDVVAAHLADRTARRSPIHVRWAHGGRADQFGFIFGFGAYVRATMLAQTVHRYGWFNGLAVLITLAWALWRTLLGGARNPWTRGDTVRISRDDVDIVSQHLYLIFGSTLHHMPMGLRPFGRPRQGLKFLAMKAPPANLLLSLPRLLWGEGSSRLERDGFVRRDADHVILSIRKSFILDGERFPGGNLTISRGEPLEFVVP